MRSKCSAPKGNPNHGQRPPGKRLNASAIRTRIETCPPRHGLHFPSPGERSIPPPRSHPGRPAGRARTTRSARGEGAAGAPGARRPPRYQARPGPPHTAALVRGTRRGEAAKVHKPRLVLAGGQRGLASPRPGQGPPSHPFSFCNGTGSVSVAPGSQKLRKLPRRQLPEKPRRAERGLLPPPAPSSPRGGRDKFRVSRQPVPPRGHPGSSPGLPGAEASGAAPRAGRRPPSRARALTRLPPPHT